MDRDSALADFDRARAEWESVFAQVPDAALGYLKPGDDYAIGGLQVHVNSVLLHYRRVLQALVDGRFAAVEPLDSAAEAADVARRTRAGIKPDERHPALKTMGELHADVQAAASHLEPQDWHRKAAVRYRAGEDPYATSPDDVLTWLRDHYREHVLQCPALVVEWKELAKGGG